MPRYADRDSDSSRLPEGFTRSGYDADEQRYYYTDAEGKSWVGPSGSQYGQLRRVGERPPPVSAEEQRAIREDEKASWRYIFPFFVLVGVFLMLVIVFLRGSSKVELPLGCEGSSERYKVGKGDTCWAIADHYNTSVDELVRENERLDCDQLPVGKRICVPHPE